MDKVASRIRLLPKGGRLPFFRSICTGFKVLNFGNNILHFHAYYPKASARLKIKARRMMNRLAKRRHMKPAQKQRNQ